VQEKLGGWGPVEIGSSLGQLVDTLGTPIDAVLQGENGPCGYKASVQQGGQPI